MVNSAHYSSGGDVISIIGCCVIQAGKSVIVHMVKGAAINRSSGLGVVCCIKVEGNGQLIYSFLIVNLVAGGGGGHQKTRKVQGEGHFYEHPRKGESPDILQCC